MKLAYIGYDQTALKTLPVLGLYFSHVDFYLASPDGSSPSVDFSELSVMARNVYIPQEASLRTARHLQVLGEIKPEYELLRQSIFGDLSTDELTLEKQMKPVIRISDWADITAFSFEGATGKHAIQLSGSVNDYDYLIVQNHQLVTDFVQSKPQTLINGYSRQSLVLLSLDFSVDYKIPPLDSERSFLYVENPSVRSVVDNWYFCIFSPKQVSVAFYIALEKHRSADFAEFAAARSQNVIKNAFSDVLEVLAETGRNILVTDGFKGGDVKLRQSKRSALFPSFTYWGQSRINDYTYNFITDKTKLLFPIKEVQA